MAYDRKHLSEGETVEREFRPHWRMLAFPVLWEVLGLAAIISVHTWIPPQDPVIDWVITGLIILALIPLSVMPFIRWWFTTYVLTNERLITRSGVVARTGIEIPLENINNVLFNQNVLERMLRSGDLLVESAGESGQSRFEDIPDPEAFQGLLYRMREARTKALNAHDSSGVPGERPEDRIEKLARLRDDGTITHEEFEAKKTKLLGEI